MFALRRKDALKEANITHIISVLRLPLDAELFVGFKQLLIEVDDDEDENLIEHFAASNKFIDDAIENGGSVLIHWSVNTIRYDAVFQELICYLI